MKKAEASDGLGFLLSCRVGATPCRRLLFPLCRLLIYPKSVIGVYRISVRLMLSFPALCRAVDSFAGFSIWVFV